MASIRPLVLQFLFLLALWLPGIPATADSFGVLSDHKKLQGHEILEVGDVERVSPNPLSRDVFKLNLRCFEFAEYFQPWSYGTKPALLLLDKTRSIKVALLEASATSVNIQYITINLVPCPSPRADVVPNSQVYQSRQQVLEAMKKRNQELQERLEQIRTQR